MRVSLNWLREYVDFDLSPEELADKLAMTGTAVESIEHLGYAFEKVVVGRIKSIRPHPNADNLVLCRLDAGGRELQIVCGAKNMKRWDKVPVALVGAVLPGGFEIKKTTIRGEVSEGMVCSEVELGIGEDASGLLILDKDSGIGEDVGKVLGLEDTVLELEITPNRPDCLGMIGIAREVAAITGGKLRMPRVRFKEESEPASSLAKVEIADPDLCPRYAARMITDVSVGPSPPWMQRGLIAAGMRPINNIVDATNYVMLETGQPLHAFDYEKLSEGKIIVRRARRGETLLTLDNVLRQLDESMLVIADAGEPIALAGVMGGADSEVSSGTRTVLLESANFNPVSVMRTSRKLGLLSEASSRFEKGVDPNGVIYAADRATQFVAKIAGGKVLGGVIDVYPRPVSPKAMGLRPRLVNHVLGTDLSPKRIAQILGSLELKVSKPVARDSKLEVTIPTFRPDLEREIDLVEEVARIYGFDRIESTLPESGEKRGGLSPDQRIRQRIKDLLVGIGLREVITYSFIDARHFEKLALPEESPLRRVVRLQNPISEEQSIMRTTLIPGLLQVLQHNTNRGQRNLHMFEVGRVFHPVPNRPLPDEPTMIAGALTGAWYDDQWYGKARSVDFFDVKGIIVALLRDLGIKDWFSTRALHPIFHPGRCAEVFVNGEVAGIFGEIHPDVQAAYGLPERVAIFELEEAKLVSHADLSRHFGEIPKYPAIILDIALVVDEKIPNEVLEKAIRTWGGKLLKEVRLFDLYRGKQIPEGKRGLAYSLVYRAEDRTLTDEEVKKIHDRIITKLKQRLGVEIRT